MTRSSRSGIWPRKKSIQKLRAAIRQKTPRTTGRSMQCTIVDVNRTLKGWFGYFQHSSYKTVFNAQDAWVRQRLRSMLRHFLKTPWTSTRTGHAAVAKCVLCQAGAVQSVNRPCHGRSILTEVRPSTGEPCAVDLHARFGGRGARTQSGLPTPIKRYRHLILSWFRAGGYDFIRRQRWNQRQVTCPHE